MYNLVNTIESPMQPSKTGTSLPSRIGGGKFAQPRQSSLEKEVVYHLQERCGGSAVPLDGYSLLLARLNRVQPRGSL